MLFLITKDTLLSDKAVAQQDTFVATFHKPFLKEENHESLDNINIFVRKILLSEILINLCMIYPEQVKTKND